MKLRTVSQVDEAMDADLQRRKKQLVTLRHLINRASGQEQDVLLRAGYCLLYSHWEGFVKGACTMYLNYLHHNPQPIVRLIPPLIALALRGDLKTMEPTRRVHVHTAYVVKLLSLGEDKHALPWSDIVDARDNLSYEVLCEIYLLLGFSVAPYETKQQILDTKLVGNRNSIAHGVLILVDKGDFDVVYDEVLAMLEWVRNDVQNALLNKTYLQGS